MIFLTPADALLYTSIPIDAIPLQQANTLMTSFVGNIGKTQTVKEKVSMGKYAAAKLQHVKATVPLISVDEVIAVSRTPFGINEDNVSLSNVEVDSMGYITYYPGCELSAMIYGSLPTSLLVTYTWGWETVPDDLKLATALVASNLIKRGTTGVKQLTDMDTTLAFIDDSIVTSDVRAIIRRYQGV